MPADSARRSLLSKLLGEVVSHAHLLDERELLLEKVGVPFLDFKDRLYHVRGCVITGLAARGDAGVVIDDRVEFIAVKGSTALPNIALIGEFIA